MAVESKIIDSPIDTKAMKAVYDKRKKNKAIKLEETKKVDTYATKQKGKPVVKEVSKGKEFSMGGYPDGVPAGVASTRWDFDEVSQKYLSGDAKEKKRRSLWDRYREIERRKGKRTSSYLKDVMQKPSVGSMKYGN
jgi:hypothetical protein